MNYSFILVRGTPGSGKTTLAQLLVNYVHQKEPAVDIFPVVGWTEAQKISGWLASLLRIGWGQDKKTIFIFDEAQMSYKDPMLWIGFFKELGKYINRSAIAFASYGSPATEGVPIVVPDLQRVTLRPIDHGDGLGAAMTSFVYDSPYPSITSIVILDDVFAIEDVVKAIVAHDARFFMMSEHITCELKGTDTLYTCDLFTGRVLLRPS